jgi:hypothetical protein
MFAKKRVLNLKIPLSEEDTKLKILLIMRLIA